MRFCKILFHRALQRREGAPFGASNRICNALWGKRLRKIADSTPEFRLIWTAGIRLQLPVLSAECAEFRCVVCIGRRIAQLGKVEGFATLNTGATATAVECAAPVARPGIFKGEIQCCAAPDDVRLGPIDKGADEFHRMPVTKTHGIGHGIRKFLAAVRVDRVITTVCRIGNLICSNREGIAGGNGEQDHIPIRHNGGFH